MKVKEVDRTANVAWSPAGQHPIYLAAGTAAQQLDASFSTSAALEVYALNLSEPGLDMSLKGSLALDHRLNAVVWGSEGMNSSLRESGILAAGSDSGNLLVYDAAKLMSDKHEEVEIFQSDKHSSAINSLDFNPFQSNLMVSGGGQSEILIWDLNNPNTPMTPGAKSQPLEDISCVAWNRQVQHILASTFPSRCVVWDLRKNEPIIKVSDSTSRLRLKVVAWHPEVATQLCFASEDDHSPVIQLWDLRFATSPLKVLESHQRGVLSIAWCLHDPDLLVSCAKDNRILCWNPNSAQTGGEVVCELATNNQWSFQVGWCPRNPALIASSSFDGHVTVYSLMGAQQFQQTQTSSKIAESFPCSDALTPPPAQACIPHAVAMPLKKPPKWLRRPVGATFAFGGKLVTFCNEGKVGAGGNQNAISPQSLTVNISQVVTESKVVENASHLEQALKEGTLADFCKLKLDRLQDQHQKMIWNFLYANFEPSPRSAMLTLLGYDPQEVATQLEPLIKSAENNNLPQNMKDLSISDSRAGEAEDSLDTFEEIASASNKAEKEAAESEVPFEIVANDGSSSGTLARALLTGNIEAAVELCLRQEQWADALVLAQAGGDGLLRTTQKRYLQSVLNSTAKLISAVVNSDWEKVVNNCKLECWKEALAAVLTYAKPDQFALLCDTLGKRLEEDGSGECVRNAMLCYICSANLESLTTCWMKQRAQNDLNNPASLQDLVEEMMILKRTVELMGGQADLSSAPTLSNLLAQYVALLATQGSLPLANTFLSNANEPSLVILKDRICVALGLASSTPYQRLDIKGAAGHAPLPSRQRTDSQSSSVSQTFQRSSGNSICNQPLQQRGVYQPPAPQLYQPQAPPVLGNIQTSAPSSYDSFYKPNLGMAQQQQGGAGPGLFLPPQATPTPPPPPVASSSSASDLGNVPIKGVGLSHRYPSRPHDPSVYSEPSYGYGGFNQSPQQFGSGPAPQQSFQPQSYFNLEQSSNANANFGGAPFPQQQSSGTFVPSASVPNQPLRAAYGEAKPGWNDPPPLKASQKKSSVPFQGALPDSMMSPYLTPQEANTSFPPPPSIPGSSFNQQQQQPQQLQPLGNFSTNQNFGQQQSYLGGGGGGPNYQPVGIMPVQQPQAQPPRVVAPPVAATPPIPKEKAPIPPENQILQDTLEDLRQQCQQKATNPQVRRKLDDVARKLESLYDKLRDNALSPNTLSGLHQIAAAIESADYQSALSIHTQLVSTTNFAETSSFMLGLKVLLQTAQQLAV